MKPPAYSTFADAPLGLREERLQTPSGWTNALPFEVGDLPELREREPNDDAEHADSGADDWHNDHYQQAIIERIAARRGLLHSE